jgi:hypothetical protein
MEWETTTTATVSPGSCRNADDDADIDLASESTVDVTTGFGGGGLGQLGGLDERSLDTADGITCGQTGLGINCSTDVSSFFQKRALTGVMSTTGTTVNGVGTKFLSELSVGDLIGSAGLGPGWARVLTVDSDIQATIFFVTGFTMGAGSSAEVIHNATVQPNNGARDRVNWIDPSGVQILVDTNATHPLGSPLTIGVAPADVWLAVWVIDDGATPGVYLSTQHEDLLAPPTGYTSGRRIGWIYNEASGGALREIYYPDGGVDRHAVYEMAGQPVQVTAPDPTPLAWADIVFSAVAPRTCRRLEIQASISSGVAAAGNAYYRERNVGDPAVNRGRRVALDSSEPNEFAVILVPCDGAQVSQYVADNANVNPFVRLYGFTDVL